MARSADIVATLAKIRAAKKLIARQDEFIRLAKNMGWEPVYGEAALKRFRQHLAGYREDLKRLTRAQLHEERYLLRSQG